MAEYITKKDTLNQGRVKINNELTKANNNASVAKTDSAQALLKAIASMNLSESVRNQLNQLIIEGDSSVEAAAARVDEKNVTHDTLKERIDDGFLGVTSQLNDIAVNVKSFGAKGDGATDDTISINQALMFLKSRGGGTLYFPKGQYLIDFVFKIDFDLKIIGDGMKYTKLIVKEQSYLFHNPTRNNNDLEATNLDNLFRDYHAVFFIDDVNFSIIGIDLDGNPTNQYEEIGSEKWNYVAPDIGDIQVDYYKYYHGIVTKYKTLENPVFVVEDCHIHGFSWNCLVLNNRGSINVDGSLIRIERNVIDTASQDLISVHNVSGFKLGNNKIINPNSHGVHLYYDVYQPEVKNNVFLLSEDLFTFHPNKPNSNKTFVIAGHGGYNDNFLEDVKINNNEFYNSLEDVNVIGISTRKTIKDLSINGNNFEGLTTCVSVFELILGKVSIKKNIGTYLNDGIVFRPIVNGVLRELNPSVPKPYSSFIFVIDNELNSLSINSRNDLDFRGVEGSDIPVSLVSDYVINLERNNFESVYVQENKVFRVVSDKAKGDWTNSFSYNKSMISLSENTSFPLLDIEVSPPTNKNVVYLLITLVGNAGRQNTSHLQYGLNIDFTGSTPSMSKNLLSEGADLVEFTLTEKNNGFATLVATIGTYTYVNVDIKGMSRYHRMKLNKIDIK